MEKKDVIQKAKNFCQEHNISNYPVNIVNLCSQNGLKVFEEYLPNDVSGFIVVQPDDFENYKTGKLIVVNLSDIPKRRRFTIAHELAHYILHKQESATLYAHRDAGQHGGIETEADTFASNILMPENLVRIAIKRLESESRVKLPLSMKISYISNEFAVSLEAARIRLENLGIS